MKLKNVVDESVYCSIGCITKADDISNLKSYLLHNKPVISQFNKIVVAHTKTDNISSQQFQFYNKVWTDLFGGKVSLMVKQNYGHTFGFTDLDSTVINISKEFGVKYIWKSTNDSLIFEKIFDVDLDDADFLYLQGHGYVGLVNYHNLNIEEAVADLENTDYKAFFPQTNFFIIKSCIDFLIDPVEFNDLYLKCIADPDYKNNSTQAEYKYMLCESVLKECVLRNKLKKKHLISKNSYKKLLTFIRDFKVCDSSHKNILFEECGICHFHFPHEQIVEI